MERRIQIPKKKKQLIAERQQLKCANEPNSGLFQLGDYECSMWKLQNNEGEFDKSRYEIDHIIEYSNGGNNRDDNLQALCSNCHSYKTNSFMKTEINLRDYVNTKIDTNIVTKIDTKIDTKINTKINTKYEYTNDNQTQFVEICKYIKTIAGDKFVYVLNGNDYNLYCFDGKIWWNDPVPFKRFISNDLYENLKSLLIEKYNNNITKYNVNIEKLSFDHKISRLKHLKDASFKQKIVKTYKEINTNNTLKFDNNWFLLGFTNIVYDLQKDKFREYKYDDYVSITTGYDWREPTKNELVLMNKLIVEIMPIENERELYLQILSTCLSGQCNEKMIMFYGVGQNGKSMIGDLLLAAFGNYGMIGNNSILFRKTKTCDPERVNMHKKRLILMSEPPNNKKIKHSIIEDFIGGESNMTLIIECNKKSLPKKTPVTNIDEIIDVQFRSTFTHDEKKVNHRENIYMANTNYKTKEFHQNHKYAFLKILMNSYKKYRMNDNTFKISKTIKCISTNIS